MDPRFVSFLSPSGFHRVAYREYAGPAGAPTLICVHGLTRKSRDFDVFAREMSRTQRVICPDMPGRGESDYLTNSAEYLFPTYLAAVAALVARLDVENVDYLGTSMGGLIGLFLAGTPGHPIRRLVINDASAVTPKAFMQAIASYVGIRIEAESYEALEAAARASYGPQPDLSDAQWREVALAGAKPKEGGGYRYDYDPHIRDVYQKLEPADVVLWPFWEKVDCPTLLLRGGVSGALTAEHAAEMIRRRPQTKLVEFPGHAHPPMLMNRDQIEAVSEFLA